MFNDTEDRYRHKYVFYILLRYITKASVMHVLNIIQHYSLFLQHPSFACDGVLVAFTVICIHSLTNIFFIYSFGDGTFVSSVKLC